MKTVTLILSLFVSISVWAQDKVWSLEDCIDFAVEHNLQKVRQKAQNKIYEADQLETIGSFVPTLSVGSNASFNFGRGIDQETNTYISTNSFGNSYNIYSSLTLFDGLASIHRVKLAKINRQKGKEELREIIDNLALETMELYFNVLYYKGTVELAEKQLEESVSNLNRIRIMEEVGLKSSPDIAEIEAKEAEDRFALTRQQNLLSLELIKLKEKMNFPLSEQLDLQERPVQTVILSSEDGASQVFVSATLDLPKIQIANYSLNAAKTDYRITKSNLSPRISLGAGFYTGFSRLMDGSPYVSFEDQLRDKQGKEIGFSLSIPILSNFSKISSVKRSKQRLIMAEAERERILRQVYSEIEQTIADVKGLSDEMFYAQKRSKSMEEAHKVNRRKFEEGLLNALELSTSANRLLNAQVEELHTQLKYQLKYRLLKYYKGESFLFTN